MSETTTYYDSLIKWHPADRSDWPEVSDEQWNSYAWQFRNRINSLADLESKMTLTSDEHAGVLMTGNKLAMGISPQFFSIIDKDDPNCPIRKQVVPRIQESWDDPLEMSDPCGEDSHMPVPGLVHRYPDRVLFLTTDRCASYCRYCTRSRVVSGVSDQKLETQWEQAFSYLEKHTEVRDVLLSGGDPLLLSDNKLDKILTRLRAIPHIQFVRIGSRIPIFLPQRVTPELCEMLKKHHPLFISVHVNHPKELTEEVRTGLSKLADAGIPLGNQSVLLKGVNDDPEVQKALVHKLLMARVRPYYLYQCDLIKGSQHFRTPVEKGLDIIKSLRGFTTGYAIPQFVIDAPGGGGKTPLNPEYLRRLDETVEIQNYEGKVYQYPNPVE